MLSRLLGTQIKEDLVRNMRPSPLYELYRSKRGTRFCALLLFIIYIFGLRTETSGSLGFCEHSSKLSGVMRCKEYFSVVEQLLASKKALGCMELVC